MKSRQIDLFILEQPQSFMDYFGQSAGMNAEIFVKMRRLLL